MMMFIKYTPYVISCFEEKESIYYYMRHKNKSMNSKKGVTKLFTTREKIGSRQLTYRKTHDFLYRNRISRTLRINYNFGKDKRALRKEQIYNV